MKTFTPGQPVEIRLASSNIWRKGNYERPLPSVGRHVVLDEDGDLWRLPDERVRERQDDRRAIAERILLADLEDDDLSARIESGAVHGDDGSVTLTVRVTIPADRIDATMRAAQDGEVSS